jgi:phosphodiester glycosidase
LFFGARRALAFACVLLLLRGSAASQTIDLPEARQLAPGVSLYHVTSPTPVNPPEPMSVWLLRLDPARIELRAALANDEVMGTEVVSSIAERHGAVAAINAGFFLPNGDPAGVLTLDRRLISDTRRPRGAVGISRDTRGVKLVFARLKATATLTIGEGANTSRVERIQIDGVDTTRLRDKLMLFTPSYNEDTDTAGHGLEWVLDRPRGKTSQPLRVVSGPHREGKTKIPPTGFVLSFGGTKRPPALARLVRGARVSLDVTYDPVEGEPEPWASAQDIVGGAGLLIRDGRDVEDWAIEAFNKGFAEGRHPRTLIGDAPDGTIWLVTVDGRQPKLSVGMTLEELRTLAHRLGLVNALNLDGGGSTTMWVRGAVVNSPSDAAGPRKVSDALLVTSR